MGLGVHEHWDSFATKKYTLIDYIHFDLDNAPVNRLDIDQKVKDFKLDNDTEQKVKEMIENYMEEQP